MYKIGNRGFEHVDSKHKVYLNEDMKIYYPQRATGKSAGYDFRSPTTFSIAPGKIFKVYTNIKAYMLENEYLDIHIRSSVAIKRDLRIKNIVAIIDADYYSNESNDGNIIVCLLNEGKTFALIQQGEKIAQGIFKKYLLTDDDLPAEELRKGGCGSTGN